MILTVLNGHTSSRSNAILRAAPPEGEGAISWLSQRFPLLIAKNYTIVGYFGLERKFAKGILPTSEAIIVVRDAQTEKLWFVYRENVYSGDLGDGFIGPVVQDTFSKQRIIDSIEYVLEQVVGRSVDTLRVSLQPRCPVARTNV